MSLCQWVSKEAQSLCVEGSILFERDKNDNENTLKSHLASNCDMPAGKIDGYLCMY